MKNQNQKVTEVIFRKYKNEDEIIALFPYQIENNQGYVGSYMHVGQHSGADYNGVFDYTFPAEESQYSDLKKELEGIGYNLKVIKKINPKKWSKALSEFNANKKIS